MAAWDVIMEQNYQITIPHIIFSDRKLSGNAKLILAEVLSLLKVGKSYCFATNEHFAEMLGLEKGNVSYHISQLAKLGWVKATAYKNCDHADCPLSKSGWHRHIEAGDTLSKILESLSSKTVEPLKSDFRPSKVRVPDKNISENNVVTNVTRPKGPDAKTQYILDAYVKFIGHPPADRQPRNVAGNFKRSVDKFLRENADLHKQDFNQTIDRVFKWYCRVNEGSLGRNLDAVRRAGVNEGLYKLSVKYQQERKAYVVA